MYRLIKKIVYLFTFYCLTFGHNYYIIIKMYNDLSVYADK